MKARPLFGLLLGTTVLVARASGAQFYTGPDGQLWAWLVPASLPGALVRLPASEMQPGCVQ